MWLSSQFTPHDVVKELVRESKLGSSPGIPDSFRAVRLFCHSTDFCDVTFIAILSWAAFDQAG